VPVTRLSVTPDSPVTSPRETFYKLGDETMGRIKEVILCLL